MPNVEVSGLRGFMRRSARLPGWASRAPLLEELDNDACDSANGANCGEDNHCNFHVDAPICTAAKSDFHQGKKTASQESAKALPENRESDTSDSGKQELASPQEVKERGYRQSLQAAEYASQFRMDGPVPWLSGVEELGDLLDFSLEPHFVQRMNLAGRNSTTKTDRYSSVDIIVVIPTMSSKFQALN